MVLEMTAHKPKPTITPERVAWFAEYYKQHPAWDVFHVALADSNWNLGSASERWSSEPWTDEVREAAAWFDTLTASQRRRLGQKAEDLANTVTHVAPTIAGSAVVTKIDPECGVVTLEGR